MPSTPVDQYEGLKLYEDVEVASTIIQSTVYLTTFFALFQAVPLLAYHFVVSPLPLIMFIALITHSAINIYGIIEGVNNFNMTGEELLDSFEERAEKFKVSKRAKFNYYASYGFFNLLRVVLIVNILYILIS